MKRGKLADGFAVFAQILEGLDINILHFKGEGRLLKSHVHDLYIFSFPHAYYRTHSNVIQVPKNHFIVLRRRRSLNPEVELGYMLALFPQRGIGARGLLADPDPADCQRQRRSSIEDC